MSAKLFVCFLCLNSASNVHFPHTCGLWNDKQAEHTRGKNAVYILAYVEKVVEWTAAWRESGQVAWRLSPAFANRNETKAPTLPTHVQNGRLADILILQRLFLKRCGAPEPHSLWPPLSSSLPCRTRRLSTNEAASQSFCVLFQGNFGLSLPDRHHISQAPLWVSWAGRVGGTMHSRHLDSPLMLKW